MALKSLGDILVSAGKVIGKIETSDKHAEAKRFLAGLKAKIDLGRSQAKTKTKDEEDYGSFGGSS